MPIVLPRENISIFIKKYLNFVDNALIDKSIEYSPEYINNLSSNQLWNILYNIFRAVRIAYKYKTKIQKELFSIDVILCFNLASDMFVVYMQLFKSANLLESDLASMITNRYY